MLLVCAEDKTQPFLVTVNFHHKALSPWKQPNSVEHPYSHTHKGNNLGLVLLSAEYLRAVEASLITTGTPDGLVQLGLSINVNFNNLMADLLFGSCRSVGKRGPKSYISEHKSW